MSAAFGSACSDLGKQDDATVRIEAADRPQALKLRQELLDGAASWGGIRVGERSAEQEGDVSLTFSLPGRNLDAALGAVNHLDADIDSTDIDVERSDVDRSLTPTTAVRGAQDQAAGQIRLRVVVVGHSHAGLGAVLRLVMAVFSLIGMLATVLWIRGAWRRRSSSRAARRRPRSIVDLSDPPTEETPIIRGDPWQG